jgi:hypothetical protein
MRVSMVDVELQLLRQHAAMSISEHPSLKEAGIRALRRAAEMIVAAKLPHLHGLQGRGRQKTKRVSQIAEAISEMMAPHQREGIAFKVFLSRWENEVLDGLRLIPPRRKGNPSTTDYRIEDENSVDGSTMRTYATLKKLYSASAQRNTG